MNARPTISPAVISWIRRSAGASVEQAARMAGTTRAQYERWEAGEIRPTVKQLRTISRAFRQPFGIFLRSEAPSDEPAAPRDFRGHQGLAIERNEPSLLIQVNMAERRRAQALELAEELSDEIPQFELHLDQGVDVEVAGGRLREALGITPGAQRAWRNGETALARLKELFEEKGVLVGQFTRIEAIQARGASVAQYPLPIILLNPKDPAVARVFTLMHEAVHLTLRASGICNLDENLDRPPEEQRIEVFCNAVAAAALVPADELLGHAAVTGNGQNQAWSDAAIDQIKRAFGVSRFVVLRRLLTLGRTSADFYAESHRRWEEEYRRLPQREGFVPPYRMAMSAAGKTFSKLVIRAYHENIITLSEASDYLRTKARNISSIEREVF